MRIQAIAACILFCLTVQTNQLRAEEEIIIKAFVDGPSDLIVSREGFQWKNGAYAKPGRWNGHDDPTYINQTAWYPQWGKHEEDRGVDTSEIFSWNIPTLDIEFELLAVGEDADVNTIEPRTPPTVSFTSDAMIISIPDPEAYPRWYVFALIFQGDQPE